MAFNTSPRRRRDLVLRRTLRPALSPPRRVAQQSFGDFERLRGSGWPGQPPSAPPCLEAACPRSNRQPPPLRACGRRPEPTARSHSGCGSGARCTRKYVPRAPSSHGGVGPLRAALERFAPSARRTHAPSAEAAPPLCSRAGTGGGAALHFASCRYARCDALCGGMRGGGAGARRTKLEDGFADSVQSWLRTAESLRRVLYARGRPAVCSRGLVDDLCRKYVHPGAALGQRRAAAAGGAGQICAAYALSLRALRRGGAPAALAHKLRRQGPAALCQPPARPLRPWAGGTRGGGAWYATHRARGWFRGPRSALGAGWRELGASPLRARPPGRLQARAPACRSRALRRRWEMPAIAHD